MPNHPVLVSGAVIIAAVAVGVSFPSFYRIHAMHDEETQKLTETIGGDSSI